MNNEQIARIWTTISVFLLFFSLDSWLRTQGLEPLFGSKLPHGQRASAAVFGLLVAGFLIPVQIYTARLYTARQTGGFSARLPVAFFKRIDPAQPESKVFQRLMYAIMQVLPLLAIVHFYGIIARGTYHLRADCKAGIVDNASSVWVWPEQYDWTDGFRLGSCDGVTFFPFLEPAILTLLGVCAVVLNVRYFRQLLQEN